MALLQRMTTATTDIAIARPIDIPPLVQLVGHYWENEQLKPFSADVIGKLIADIVANPELGQCWVARNAGGMQGYLICSCVPSFEYGGLLALIADLYVAPDARRSGVGQQLVHAAEHAMRARGCVHIAMEVAQKNVRAQQFYSILGFATRAGYSTMHKAL
ncbi:MAG TPA: GNAT family N-acetyltransferase [Steroidobacteraceae bacterium]|jgi:ribosomal protein S18 acetylase RimI-like enzyme|nr:GNAT family N-acetyltransferase [Steroidobacteraceae bacterium]